MDNKPTLNSINNSFTTRDSLGIESTLTSIVSEISPIINNVTPRPFYWCFMCWIYYDFYKNIRGKRRYENFDYFLKRQDYFFVLSQLLANNSDRRNMAGTTKATENIGNNKNDLFECDRTYYKTRFGGMQYYNAGLFTMDYIKMKNDDPETQGVFPKLTIRGEEMALAFGAVIKNTEYYKNTKYRLEENPVPKNVLIEYGKVINLSLKGFDQCKNILKEYMSFETNESYKYALFLADKEHIFIQDGNRAREVLFDYYSPRSMNKKYPIELKPIVNKWEIAIGRQYFVISLEMIWKYMLNVLENPKGKRDWIEYALKNSSFDIDINGKLSTIIESCNYSFVDREKIIDSSRKGNLLKNIQNGLNIIISIYNRFKSRNDFDDSDKKYLSCGENKSIESLSIEGLIKLVNKYMDRTIVDFLTFIMDKWLICQHYRTAIIKAKNKKDGFYYELIDGIYHKKKDFDFNFQDIRFVSLMGVMYDLDIIKKEW